MGMNIMDKFKKYVKPEHLRGKKALTPYLMHKHLIDMGVIISQSNAVSGWEKAGTRRMFLDHLYALEELWVKLTDRPVKEFHDIMRKEFGTGSKYRK